MPSLPHSPVTAVDGELRALCEAIRAASRELAEVRRWEAELVGMEAALVAAVDAGMRGVDDLLDRRCTVSGLDGTPAEQPVTDRPTAGGRAV